MSDREQRPRRTRRTASEQTDGASSPSFLPCHPPIQYVSARSVQVAAQSVRLTRRSESAPDSLRAIGLLRVTGENVLRPPLPSHDASLGPSPSLYSGWKEAASPLLSSYTPPLTPGQERGNTGRKEDYRWHGSWLKSGAEGSGERRVHDSPGIFLARGGKGAATAHLPPTYPAACPAPVGSAAAAAGGRQRGRCPIESPMTFNFERGASSSPSSSSPPPSLSFLFQLSFRSFIFPPAAVAAHHDLRRSPDRGRVGVVVGVEEREEALLSIEPRCPPIFLCRKYLRISLPRQKSH